MMRRNFSDLNEYNNSDNSSKLELNRMKGFQLTCDYSDENFENIMKFFFLNIDEKLIHCIIQIMIELKTLKYNAFNVHYILIT